jgi:hypothetical protein
VTAARLVLGGVILAALGGGCQAFEAADAPPSARSADAGADSAESTPYCQRRADASACVDFENGGVPNGWGSLDPGLAVEKPGFESTRSLRARGSKGETPNATIGLTVPATTANTTIELDLQLDDPAPTESYVFATINFVPESPSPSSLIHLGFAKGSLFLGNAGDRTPSVLPFPQKQWVHLTFTARWANPTVVAVVQSPDPAGVAQATYALTSSTTAKLTIGLKSDQPLDHDVSVRIDNFVARVE